MTNCVVCRFNAASLTLQYTVVTPTAYRSPDATLTPKSSTHVILVEGIRPSTISVADRGGAQTIMLSALPASTEADETLFGVIKTGGSLSV